MKKTTYILVIFTAVFTVAFLAFADLDNPLVRFSIKTDKQIYRTDEDIILFASIKNLSSRLYYLQALRPFLNTKIVVKAPSGKKFELIDDRGPFFPTDYLAVLAGTEVEYARLNIKHNNYIIKSESETDSEPFKESGTYEISCAYRDLTPAIEKALKGVFTAETIKISIVSLGDLQQKIAQKREAEKKDIKKRTQEKTKDISGDAINANPQPNFAIGKEEAIILAQEYIKNQEAYEDKKMDYLFISDSAEKGSWVVSFEEKKSKIFHAMKVNERTGDTEEAFFLE